MSKNNFEIGSDHDQCYFTEGNLHFGFFFQLIIFAKRMLSKHPQYGIPFKKCK